MPKIRRRRHWLRDTLAFVLIVGSTAAVLFWISVTGSIFENTGNITLTFQRSGFIYSFASSVVDIGIKRPIEYSRKTMEKLQATIRGGDRGKSRETYGTPNVIFVQLESIFDVDNMKNYTYSEDPMPNLHRLMKQYTTGYLTVPTVGAGTVNTEFEILTGMSMKYFGLCEYPYKSILKKENCESIAYNLQERGYKTAVVHNNKGSFYSRNVVFSHLGFDVFDSMEYMTGLEYNPIDWVKDDILTERILRRMKETKGRDFIFTITVQSHGKYPTEQVDFTQNITIDGEENEGRRNGFEYYVNQCRQTDEFVGALIQAVGKMKEDTVIVFYGDHLPTLDITDAELDNQTIYQTSYVIWDNIGLSKKDEDLAAYQLSASVMAKLGYSNGVMTRYHQVYKRSANYDKNMELLQYDMLYGDKYVYGGVELYDASDLQMGLDPIALERIRQGDGVVTVIGRNFTEFSTVFLNGKKQDTVFINDRALQVKDLELDEGDRLIVRQLTSSGGKLSKTDELIFQLNDE